MFYKNAPKNTGEGTFFNPSQASRDSVKGFLDVFNAGRGGSSYRQGAYTPRSSASDYYEALSRRPLTVGSGSGRSTTVGDGSLSILYPDTFDPIVFPGGSGSVPQGKSTGQRLAGAALGAGAGFVSGGPVGAVIGGLGSLFG
jgi:hypothetical protein